MKNRLNRFQQFPLKVNSRGVLGRFYHVSFCWLAIALCSFCTLINHASAATPPIPITGKPSGEPLSDFDRRFIQLLRRWGIPGGSVAIMHHHRLVLARGYGWANVERREPVRPNSLFRIASVSKAITAVTILQLVQQHRISLNSRVFDILNQLQPLQNTKSKPQIYRITVRDLLQMSSGWGLSRNGADPMFGPWTERMVQLLDYNVPPDCLTAGRMIMSVPLQFAPGKSFSYSNINYCLLGLIINKVTGLHGDLGYESYIRKQLLEPLGIDDMRIGETSRQGRFPREVTYYYYGDGYHDNSRLSGLPYSDMDILKKNYADGGWVGSAIDLVKFTHAVGTQRVLSPYMLKVMTAKPAFYKKQDKYFALGWTVKQRHGHRYWMKTGSFTGTMALVVHRDDGRSYAALFNAKPAERVRFTNELQTILHDT